MFLIFQIFLTLLSGVVSLDSENVMIETIDLTVEIQQDGKSTVMEAYRSTRNDEILRNNKTLQFGQLEWHSIGSPTLAHLTNKHSSTLSYAQVFETHQDGFNILFEVLTNSQKEVFRDKIKSKYGINVDLNQIIKLVPSELKCSLDVICPDGKRVKIEGEAESLSEFPLKVSFKYPINSTELICFEHDLIEYQHVEINCVIRKKSKTVKQNIFRMTTDQMNRISLVDKLFGDASEVFVTRNQLANLALEVHSSFRVEEEYEIKGATFSETFVEGLISQTNANFKHVAVDEAFKYLSKYSIKDIDPDVVRKNMSKILKVKKDGDKEHIVVNNEFSLMKKNSNKVDSKTNFEASSSSFLEILGIGGKSSVDLVVNKEKHWQSSGKSVRDQLNELNSESQDSVQWEIEGEKIVPKTLNLSRLIKSSFRKDFQFERIRREVNDYIFNKRFTLQYKDG